MFAALFIALPVVARQNKSISEKPLFFMKFDEERGESASNSINNSTFNIVPSCDWIKGVEGNAILFNGFTTRIIVPAANAPVLGDSFTIDFWFAAVSFPKSQCPVICQRSNPNASPCGFSLELDAQGHVIFRYAAECQWKEVISSEVLPLRQWARVSCMYDAGKGIQIAINGKIVAQKSEKVGRLITCQENLWIGRTPFKIPSQYENENIPIFSSLDGALDNLCIANGTKLFAKILKKQYLTKSPTPPVFEARRLPTGPSGALAFGAWYIPLKYYKQWDEQWRGETSDVVVGFGEKKPFRVVFWRGTAYAPCFVTEKGNWMSNEFIERLKVTKFGCCESMSDKHAYFSSVKILENTPGRTVIQWRNSPVGVNLQFPYEDVETGWGDWSEETYVFYPDGVGIRKMTLWSSHLNDWYEWSQSLQVLQPGQRPEDVLDDKKIMSVANMKGENKIFGWDFDVKKQQHEPSIPGANIQVSYLRSEWNPFLIMDDCKGPNENSGNGPEIFRYAGHWSKYSKFPWRNHWPVTQDQIIGRDAVVADGPAHTYTATQYNAAESIENGKMTKLMMCGCTKKNAGDLLTLAKSWLRAPQLNIIKGNVSGGNYDKTERAYKMKTTQCGEMSFILQASIEHPADGICFYIEGWNGSRVLVLVNGKVLEKGKYCVGHLQKYNGETLVLWMGIQAQSPVDIEIEEESM